MGARKSSFKFDVINFNFRTSSLNGKDKENLKRMAHELGAKIVSSVDEATHIVTNQITLTMKVIMGLVKGIPIVATSYVKELCSNSQWNRPLPSPENFGPFIISEECTSDMLRIRPERKTLLKNKTFVFLSKDQYNFYNPLIEYASGKALDLAKKITELGMNRLEQYIDENKFNIWINPINENDNSNEKLLYIIKMTKKKGINFINVEEIAKSILHVDINTYCNPVLPNNDVHSSYDENPLRTSTLLDQSKDIISKINSKKKEAPPENIEEKATKSSSNMDVSFTSIDTHITKTQIEQMNMEEEIELNNLDEDIVEDHDNIFDSLLLDSEVTKPNKLLEEEKVNIINEVQNDKEFIFDIEYNQIEQAKETLDHTMEINSEKEVRSLKERDEVIYNYKIFKKQKLETYTDLVIAVTFENI